MASLGTWVNYHSGNTNKGTDEEVLSMIQDVVDTIRLLEKMYGPKEVKLVTRSLLDEWNTLRQMADARNLHTYARP